MAALCEMHGVSPVRIHPADCGRSLRDVLVIDDAPVANPIVASLAAVLRKQGVRLLLTGEGGDDVLGGDMRVFVDRALRGHPLTAIRDAARLRALWGTPWSRIRSLVLLPAARRLPPDWALDLVRRVRRRRRGSAWAGPELRRVLAGDLAPLDPPRCERSHDRSWLDHQSRSSHYLSCSEARAQTELLADDLSSGGPLLDAEVVDFVASLSPEQLFHDGWLRGLYREALRGWVPESLRVRPDKAGFGPTICDLAGGAEGIAALGDLARCDRLADLGIVEPRPMGARFKQLVHHPDDPFLWAEILPVLSAEAFLESSPTGFHVSSDTIHWLHQWPPTGPVAVSPGRAADDLIAEWPGFGTLRSDAAGTRSEFTPGRDAPPHVQERLGEVVAALLRHLRGGITLHASERQLGRAWRWLACGESGAGKSTLAA